MKYRQGHCALNGEQVWVKGAKGELVRPRSSLREGYVRFADNVRVKVPLCVNCENATKSDPETNLPKIMDNLFMSQEVLEFQGQDPVGYDEFENYWNSQGKNVVGVWKMAHPGE